MFSFGVILGPKTSLVFNVCSGADFCLEIFDNCDKVWITVLTLYAILRIDSCVKLVLV